METIQQLLAQYSFTELRILMQLPSNQLKTYDYLKSQFKEWLNAMPIQQINKIHFQQWLTNFITANQSNAQLVLEQFTLTNYDTILTKETQKPFLIFIHNMIKNNIDQEQFLFNSFFSQHIVQTLEQTVSTQLEWVTYCLVAIFNKPYSQSFLAKLSNMELLDLVFQLLQKTIDDKIFPSIVHNHNPHILDIKNLYSNDQKLGIRLSEQDINFIKQSDFITDLQKFKFYAIITFLGGYNQKVQELFYPDQFNQAIQQLKILKDQEIISVMLRFIANMVHLNKAIWETLKNDLHLLDPIIVYTNSQSLQQIREWAILIVRNLCDCEELRDYLLKK